MDVANFLRPGDLTEPITVADEKLNVSVRVVWDDGTETTERGTTKTWCSTGFCVTLGATGHYGWWASADVTRR